jgi:hypothetical protein
MAGNGKGLASGVQFGALTEVRAGSAFVKNYGATGWQTTPYLGGGDFRDSKSNFWLTYSHFVSIMLPWTIKV